MRFYHKLPAKGLKVRVTGDEARHIKVFRLQKGDQVELFDGLGNEAKGTIEAINSKEVIITIVQRGKVRVKPYSVALATAFPKGKRLDWLIQKATELGVDEIIPILSSRSIVKPKSESKRLQKIIIDACKQSGRGTIPEIRDSVKLSELKVSEYDLKVSGVPGGVGFKEILQSKRAKKIIILVGPEGGFADSELEVIKEKGFVAVDLGKEILRIETAGIYMLSAIKYEINN